MDTVNGVTLRIYLEFTNHFRTNVTLFFRNIFEAISQIVITT